MIRILMPSIVDPSVEMGGAWTSTRTLLRLLRDGPLAAEVVVVAVRRRSRAAHRLRQCMAIGRSLISGRPAKIEFCRSRRMLSEVNQWLSREQFDLVLINGTDLVWLLPHLPAKMARVVMAHNIEHQLFASRVRRRVNTAGPVSQILERDQRKLKQYEMEGLRQTGNAIFLSSADAAYAAAECPGLRSLIVPPMFDDLPAPPPARKKAAGSLDIGMLANFEWWPNREGLRWFLTDVFPRLSPGITLHLFGHRSKRVAPRHPRIVAHGYLPRIDRVWSACDFMICPVVSGGGVCVKFAEAVYHRMPVLGTRFSARGLPLDPDPSIVLLDSAEEWVEFLNSDARSLAERTVSPSIASRFCADRYAPALSEFLSHSAGKASAAGR